MSMHVPIYISCTADIPRLAQPNVGDSVFVTKGKLDVAKCMESAAVEADILLKSFEYESSLII